MPMCARLRAAAPSVAHLARAAGALTTEWRGVDIKTRADY